MQNVLHQNRCTKAQRLRHHQLPLRRKLMHVRVRPLYSEIAAKQLLASLLLFMTCNVLAQASLVGFVDLQRLLSESKQAQESIRSLGKEFNSRDRALEALAVQIRSANERLERDQLVLDQTAISQRQKELSELRVQFERKQQDLREDVELRRQEEIARLLKLMNRVIHRLAREKALDLVVQEAIFVTETIDLTESVLRALEQRD